jgi:hypothetical protein
MGRTPIKINKGDKYNRLTIVEEIEPIYDNQNKMVRIVKCICECGNESNYRLNDIKRETTKSCGCLHKELSKIRSIKRLTTHNKSKYNEYRIWSGMKTRCYNSKRKDYVNYGGRGITVCDRWINSFENFYKDMGDRPLGTTIDRYPNNDGNYEPSNCKWSTPKEQINNRRKYEIHNK